VERVEDVVADARLEVHELRCRKCGKARFVGQGDRAPVGQATSGSARSAGAP